ncbi:hypothetical protein BDZ91DRAFT_774100 [Kalaharituber pfeilii]|nr:hypothetical protein BDZ91DRAFT_774100 [Kalaharituber pfeilii]
MSEEEVKQVQTGEQVERTAEAEQPAVEAKSEENNDVATSESADAANGQTESTSEADVEKDAAIEKEKTEKSMKEDATEAPATKIPRASNIVSDPSVLPESNDPAEIRKQVEFYFSDSNLRFDKFLYGLVGKENKYVSLKLIASFKRMQRFKDFSAIIAALESSELLELNPQKTMVRRKVPLPTPNDYKQIKEVKDRAQSRSLYAKGFGEENPTTQFDIEKFFEPYGPINAVRLRRTDDNVFKGSVFVEFKDDQLMEKFMAMEEKPKYQDKALECMRKKDYVDMKIRDIKEGKIVPQASKKHAKKFDAFAQRGRGGYHKSGGRDNDAQENGDNEKGDRQKNGRGGRGRGRGRGGRGRGRGGRGGGNRDGDRNKQNGADEHTVPTVQASTDQGVKRQREDADVGNEEKKPKIESVA